MIKNRQMNLYNLALIYMINISKLLNNNNLIKSSFDLPF
jgi:hypothetical protein